MVIDPVSPDETLFCHSDRDPSRKLPSECTNKDFLVLDSYNTHPRTRMSPAVTCTTVYVTDRVIVKFRDGSVHKK